MPNKREAIDRMADKIARASEMSHEAARAIAVRAAERHDRIHKNKE